MITYEQKLDRDRAWALREGSMHFEKASAVHKTLERITRRLDELRIPYAVVGSMAMFQHGYRRFTEDVDLLVTRPALQEIHQRLEGRGYLPPFAGSKQLRDTDTGVKLEFLVTGEYPGDGLPKPVAFPDPGDSSIVIDDMRVLTLPKLIELKLASGMTGAGRLKDLGDVESLIQVLNLPGDFGEQLDPFVRGKFREIWEGVQRSPKEP
ncbi:MAG: nucleotidyltransferase family protein [Gemmataceae bacterium]|nr:nucleotidyltransferase family protein [Gemmataceae bacterium]